MQNTKNIVFFMCLLLLHFFILDFLQFPELFYVELIFILILFFALSKKDANKFLTYIFIFLFLAIVFFAFVLDNVNVLFDAISGRFDEGTGGRDILLENSIKIFFGNDKVLFFGAGTYYPYILGFTAHNLIFDSLVALGSFGCLIYYTLIYRAYSNLKRFGQKFNLVNYMPLIMALAYSMIYGRVVNTDYYYILSVCFMFTQYDYEGKSKICCIASH